ncbi:MAG: hypothetical protein ABI197_08530 [Granulicella sp.]
MASAADAELVLKLYELRQEESLRQARRFLVSEFNPKTLEELRAVSREKTSDKNVFWRQATTYWEMAASLVVKGALDADLYLASNGEGLLIYAKFHHFHAESEKETGLFMKQTATLIERYPAAKAIYSEILKRFGSA